MTRETGKAGLHAWKWGCCKTKVKQQPLHYFGCPPCQAKLTLPMPTLARVPASKSTMLPPVTAMRTGASTA